MKIRQSLGILRSRIMYYAKPRNRQRLKRFYAPFVPKGSLCFDIGAHLGNRSDAWLALGAKVVAVEPQPACIRYLKRHFEDNPDFTLLEAALGERSGRLPLYVSELTPTISTLADESWRQAMADKTSFHVQWDQTIEVPVYSLEQLIEQYGIPDFCKLDVEDFELPILKGLQTAIPSLSFEYFIPSIQSALACIEELERIGAYEYNWSFGESQRFEREKWINSSEMKAILAGYGENDRSGDVYARLL
ncbi:MAG: FkbM family methyltransferase [Bacteroidota bacterium]